MAIHRWHWGKLVILWSWGGLAAAFLLTVFVSTPVLDNPVRATVSLLVGALILVLLSGVTWVWLTGKEQH